jgi:hypothetical protein
LIAAADAVPADGDDLLHLDIRSDNPCFRENAAVLVDWNRCSTDSADLDVAAWLPGHAVEVAAAVGSPPRGRRARGVPRRRVGGGRERIAKLDGAWRDTLLLARRSPLVE